MAFVTIQDLGSGTVAGGVDVTLTAPANSHVIVFTGSMGGGSALVYTGGTQWSAYDQHGWAGIGVSQVFEAGGSFTFNLTPTGYTYAYRVLAVVRPEGWRWTSTSSTYVDNGVGDLARVSGYNGNPPTGPGAALTASVLYRLCGFSAPYGSGACPNPGTVQSEVEDLGGLIGNTTDDPPLGPTSAVSIFYRLQETAWTSDSIGVDYATSDWNTFLYKQLGVIGPGHEWYGNTISQVLYPDTRRAVASCITGSLILNPRTDAIPDGTAGNTTGETTGVTRVELLRLPTSGHLYLAYLVNGTAKLRRVDGYGLALDTASTVQSGSYSGMCAALDEKQGRIGVMLWDSSTAAWSITLGTQDSGGVTWSWSTPVTVQTGTKVNGQLLCTPEGVWLFAYRDTSGVAKLLTCRNLSSTGNGTWASTTISSGYNGVTLAYDRRRGILLAGLYLLSSTRWDLMTGTLNSGGTAWSWGTARTITTGKTGAGHFLQRGSGEWIFQSASTGLAQTSVRCKNLQADGTGTWT